MVVTYMSQILGQCLGTQSARVSQQLRMYDGSGTVDRIASGQTADELHTQLSK